ncbi:MAG: methylated-DNA--[protein]-cysteine S-methyltransferase [Saprospiraceae bacterium]|nr:methylated-DNA--[protein]-cysteine S-methyltransferase [Saprospiraceae bacterium]
MSKSASLPPENEMYKALVRRDTSYEGVFFVGVKTTGIFCRPTCRARKPKRQNTEFFRTTKEALDHGYRACKVCDPMLNPGTTPSWISNLIHEIHQHPDKNIRDWQLRERQLDPVKVRRWFHKTHGITFHAYQRSLRLNHAFGRLQKGEKITDTAYDLGYESLSGFTDAFKKKLGFSPGESGNQIIVNMIRFDTPLGPMVGGATSQGICLLEFADRRMLETQIKKIKRYFAAQFIPGMNPHLESLSRQLKEYFMGQRSDFEVPLLYPGTEFQMKVWENLCKIPVGQTRSYTQQAIACERPNAVRAVAHANGDNRISILIPCHRVIGADGSLTGYGGGIWRKKWLLEHESRMLQNQTKG